MEWKELIANSRKSKDHGEVQGGNHIMTAKVDSSAWATRDHLVP